MTDAPERIWLRYEPGCAVLTGPLTTHPAYTQYLRADIADAQIKRLQDELLDLQSRRVSVVRDYMKREAEQRERADLAATRLAALEADIARERERVAALDDAIARVLSPAPGVRSLEPWASCRHVTTAGGG